MKGAVGFLARLFVRLDDNASEASVRAAYGKLGGAVGIVCNLLLFALKLVAGLISGSFSVIADAFNNLSDLGSSLITLLGFKLAARPADKDHPFGHGRMEYISALLVSCLIVLVGAELLKGSVDKIIEPTVPEAGILTVVILLVSVALKLCMYFFNRQLGKQLSSDALIAAAGDSLNDCISTAAVLVTLAVLRLTDFNADAYVGIAVSAFIIFSGIKSIKETIDPILGKPADKEDIEKIVAVTKEFDEFLGAHDIIVHNYGPGRVFCSLHAEVSQNADIVRCHEQADRCEREIYERLGISAVIHTDPVAVGDPLTDEIKACLSEVLGEISPDIRFHDFRIVNGRERINVIFDVVAKRGAEPSGEALKLLISSKMRQRDERYTCVITVDDDYSSSEE